MGNGVYQPCSLLLLFLLLAAIQTMGSQAILVPRQNTNTTSSEWTVETFDVSRLCRIHGASTTLINNTLWVNGGEVVVHECNGYRGCISWLDINNYVFAIPFNESRSRMNWNSLNYKAYRKPRLAPLTHRSPLWRNKLGTELYTFAGNSTKNDTSANHQAIDWLMWKFTTKDQVWTETAHAPLLWIDLQYCSVPSLDKSFVFGPIITDPESALIVVDSGAEKPSDGYRSINMTGGPSGAIWGGSMVHIPVPGGDGVLLLFGGLELFTMSDIRGIPMETVNLYDIGSGKWFEQRTSTESTNEPYPSPRHNFCAVLVSSGLDPITFDIILYGGDTQTRDESRYASGIWILSIPSFRWFFFEDRDTRTQLSGTSCQVIGQHLIRFGGWLVNDPSPELTPICENPVSIFNLDSFTWTDRFNPEAGPYTPRAEINNWNRYHPNPSQGWSLGVQEIFRGLNSTSQQEPPSPKPTSPNKKPNLGAIIGGVVALVLVLIAAFFIIKKRLFNRAESIEEAPGGMPEMPVDGREPVEMPAILELVEMPTVIERAELPGEGIGIGLGGILVPVPL